MSDFEYCGWDDCDQYFIMIHEEEIISNETHTCVECMKEIRQGDTCHVYLWDELFYSSLVRIVDLEKGVIDIDISNKSGVKNVVTKKCYGVDFPCEACADLYQSLIDAGKEPRIGEIYACRDEMIRHQKADSIEAKLRPLMAELIKILSGTKLYDKVWELDDCLSEYVDRVRYGDE